MRRLYALGLALAFAAPLFAAAQPPVAAASTEVKRFTTSGDPFVTSWGEGADGVAVFDSSLADLFANLVSDTVWVAADGPEQGEDVLLVAAVNNGNLEPALPLLNQVHTQDLTLFAFHRRATAEDGTITLIEGTAFTFNDTPNQGLAVFTMHVLRQNGELLSAYIEQDLAVASAAPAPTPTPPANPSPIPGVRG